MDVFQQKLQPDDLLLLCSDGLWKMVHNKDLLKVLSEKMSPQKKCEVFIELANANGGEDNISSIVVEVKTS